MVRIAWVVLLALMLLTAAGSAFAYRLVLTPTADVLPDGVYKLEVSAPYNDNMLDEWLPGYRFDGNIAKNVDIAIKGGCPAGEWRANGTLVNLNWQVTKETKSMPAFGMGIWNLYDSNDDPRVKESFFVGASKTVDVGLKFPIKTFLNVGTKQLNGLSGGIVIPMSKRFSGALEWVPEGTSDSKSLRTPGCDCGFVWALGYNQTQNWRFKYANVDGDDAWGVVYTNKWLTK